MCSIWRESRSKIYLYVREKDPHCEEAYFSLTRQFLESCGLVPSKNEPPQSSSQSTH